MALSRFPPAPLCLLTEPGASSRAPYRPMAWHALPLGTVLNKPSFQRQLSPSLLVSSPLNNNKTYILKQ